MENKRLKSLSVRKEYKDIVDFIEKLDKEQLHWIDIENDDSDKNVFKIHYFTKNGKEKLFSEKQNVNDYITVNTSIKNEKNDFSFKLKMEDSTLIVQVKTVSSGITSFNTFLFLLKFLIKEGIRIESEDEPWLTCEVITGIVELYEKINSNKISEGMYKSAKDLGRPVDEEVAQKAIEMYESGNYTGQQIADKLNISRSTLYRYVKKRG